MVVSKNWKDLVKPKFIEVDEETHSNTYGKFVCAPLERGFGITIGNALRRILLSSICGAAITAVRIDGVLHEFSVIPGVLEDVTQIILNLKGVRVKLLNNVEKAVMHLDVSGESDVRAGDITTDGNVEILNPDHYIAHLAEDAKLKMEIEATLGRGYVPVEKREGEEHPPGTILVDALYSPIKKVNYTVTPARVGQSLDYDTLTMEIWTDGSVLPEDALVYAARIMREYLNLFTNFEEEIEEEEEEVEEAEIDTELIEKLNTKVDELELTVRATNCLKNMGIQYIGELVQIRESDLLKAKNFGKKSLNEIKAVLEDIGLELGLNYDELPAAVKSQLKFGKTVLSVESQKS